MIHINLVVEAEECPYWNYDDHACRHTCQSCRCMEEGNNLENSEYGIRVGSDRYCTLHSNVHGELVNVLNSRPDGFAPDGTPLYLKCARGNGKTSIQMEMYRRLLGISDEEWIEMKQIVTERLGYTEEK